MNLGQQIRMVSESKTWLKKSRRGNSERGDSSGLCAGSGALLCFHQWPGRKHQIGADQKRGYVKVTPSGEA